MTENHQELNETTVASWHRPVITRIDIKQTMHTVGNSSEGSFGSTGG